MCSASDGLCAYIFMRSGIVGRTKLSELIDAYHRGGNDTESAGKFLPIETVSCVCLSSRRLDGVIWNETGQMITVTGQKHCHLYYYHCVPELY